MRVFTDLAEIRAARGETLGTSDWLSVEQQHIDGFAEATGDRQWIHVDPARAADGPFGTTIAHGFLTLSLLPVLAASAYRIENVGMAVNYGLNRVRFTAPVPVGSRVRATAELVGDEDTKDGAVQLSTSFAVELEGSERPAVVAEWLVRYYA
ncbi:MaoC family dehydratase [Pseudonocardia sp. P1]|uniref:MaoC family dehydratase n=1 Tax=Pseudonocardia sp. P1 TaxID=761194 RepID=UPI0001FFE6A9|nr:MaoC family dehydratase [Pseudonocardia sp. Ae707_Ps1]OLM08941.1 Acyl dehydratase [Pseudonocardia sp. Ae707_Ps1]